MTCCSYPFWHVHYPQWLLMGDSVKHCKCGGHSQRISVETLLVVWKSRW